MSQDSNEKPATLLWYGVVAAVVSTAVFISLALNGVPTWNALGQALVAGPGVAAALLFVMTLVFYVEG